MLSHRVKVVQTLLNHIKSPVYLEIGVEFGRCFSRITATRKIAVDPNFRMSRRRKAISESKAVYTHFFEARSDDFFAQNETLLTQNPINVAFVDGLHTYQQSLRDIENILRYMQDGGVIVMHDCNPKRESFGYPAKDYEDFRKKHPFRISWSGDVWKAIVSLRATRSDLNVAVLDCDWGIGLIKQGPAESRLDYSPQEIENLSYADLARNRTQLLNLKPADYFQQFIA